VKVLDLEVVVVVDVPVVVGAVVVVLTAISESLVVEVAPVVELQVTAEASVALQLQHLAADLLVLHPKLPTVLLLLMAVVAPVVVATGVEAMATPADQVVNPPGGRLSQADVFCIQHVFPPHR
jgi:hypothetical protein